MWPCARTDIVHPQRSYLTVGRLKFTQWRSAFRRCSQFAGGEPSEKFLVVDNVNTCFSVKQIRSAIIFMCSFHSGMRSFHLVTCYFHLIMHSLHLVMCSFYLVACVLFIRPSIIFHSVVGSFSLVVHSFHFVITSSVMCSFHSIMRSFHLIMCSFHLISAFKLSSQSSLAINSRAKRGLWPTAGEQIF